MRRRRIQKGSKFAFIGVLVLLLLGSFSLVGNANQSDDEKYLEDGYVLSDDQSYYEKDTEKGKVVVFKEGIEEFTFFHTFNNDKNVVEITYPNSAKNIIPLSFKAVRYNLKENNPYFIEQDGIIFTKDMEMIVAYPSKRESKSYSLPLETKIIGEFSFDNTKELEKLVLHNNVTEIEEYAFYYGGLKEIQFPDSIKKIGRNAFYYTNLENVTIPESVEKIEFDSFTNCKQLKEVTFNASQKLNNIFLGCESLERINIGKEVTFWFLSERENGDSFYEYVVEEGNDRYQSYEGVLYITNAEGEFMLTSYPKGKKDLEYTVFDGTSRISLKDTLYLKKINLPSTLKDVSFKWGGKENLERDIVRCSSLESYEISEENSQYRSMNGVWYSKDMKEMLLYPNAKKDITFVVPEEVEKLHYAPFDYNSYIKNIVFLNDTASIGKLSRLSDFEVTIWGNKNSEANIYADDYNHPFKELVNEVKIDENSIYMKEDEEYKIITEVLPQSAANKTLKWYSENQNIAKISLDGKITAISEGKTKVVCETTDGSGIKQEISVDVIETEKPLQSIQLSKSSLNLYTGKSETLQVSFVPANATTDKEIKWTSSNNNVVAVDNTGKVIALEKGNATITAQVVANSNIKASCQVTVADQTSVDVEYKINYVLNGGKNNSSNPSTYSKQDINLKNPSRNGYEFKGWYIDSAFKTEIKTIKASTKKDVVLYAKWSKVNPKATKIKSVSNVKGKKAKVTITKKISNIDGYEVTFATDKKFKKNVKKVNMKSNSKSVTVKGLKKGKTYNVRVRAYKKDSTGKKIYGKAANTKKVTIKK